MYARLCRVLPPRAANLVFVVVMAALISATLLLAAFPESSLGYARL